MGKIDFEWQVGGEGGEWETIAETKRQPQRKWSWRVLVTAGLLLLVASTASYLFLRRRFQEANRQITFQIQSVIDLEVRAWNRGDVDLYLRQQDELALDWYGRQTQLIRERHERGPAEPLPPIQISQVNVQGDVAWVETIQGPAPLRQMRFYRREANSWLHTAPDETFWGTAVEYRYGEQLIFRYHQRDQPYIDPLLDRLGKLFYKVRRTVYCPETNKFEIHFVTEFETGQPAPHVIFVSSPWISGIPLEGEWSDRHIERAARMLAYRVALAAFPDAPYLDNSPQRAIIDEYAVWMSTQDPTQAPILGRIIARHGPDILPQVFESFRDDPTTLGWFLERWLALDPPSGDNAVDYFEMLLNIEQEAFLAGRRDTFLLLQDSQEAMWQSHQEYVFDQVQDRAALSFPPIKVDRVVWAQDHALITSNAPRLLHSRPVTVFRLRNGDWKHNDFASTSYRLPALPNATPTPTPNAGS